MLHPGALAFYVFGLVVYCVVGTAHTLKKPVVCGYIMRHTLWVLPETTTTATLASVRERLEPVFCNVARSKYATCILKYNVIIVTKQYSSSYSAANKCV